MFKKMHNNRENHLAGLGLSKRWIVETTLGRKQSNSSNCPASDILFMNLYSLIEYGMNLVFINPVIIF